jgi:hypothetical protein
MCGRKTRSIMETSGVVESAYSVIKCIFSEYVSARKLVDIAKEIAMKVSLYNVFMQNDTMEDSYPTQHVLSVDVVNLTY